MTVLFRIAAALTLAAALYAQAVAQAPSCDDKLAVDGTDVCVNFSVLPGTVGSKSVSVHETFAAGNKRVEKNVLFDVIPGAEQSRTIDDIDIGALLPGKSLHNTLSYDNATGLITLERSLLLPGAIKVR